MLNLEENKISVGPVTIAYQSVGEAKKGTLIFSHSLFFDKSMFRHQLEYLSRDYRVIAYDHRGQGGTGAAADGRYDVEAATEDAIQLIEKLNLGPVHFVGNSLGGFVALRLAARRPDLVHSVIAMGSSGDEEENPDHLIPLYDHLLQHGGQGAEEGILGMMFSPFSVASADFAEEREKWRAHMHALTPLVAGPGAGVVFRGGINRALTRSSVPILAIAGADDVIYPEHLSATIAKAAPKGEWTSIKLAGHSLALEQPQATNAVIEEFLNRVITQKSLH